MDSFLPAGRRPYKRDEQVRRIARRIVKLVPALDKVELRPLVANYARIVLLSERAYAHLREGGLVNAEGELRQSLNTYRCLVKELRDCARELGLSPSTSALLAKPVSYLDLESLRNAEAEDPE